MKKIIISIIPLVLILVILFFLNLKNKSGEIDLFQLRKNIKSYEKLPADSEITRKITELNLKRNKIEPFLFDGNNPVIFIEQIEKISKEQEVELSVENAESIKPEEDKIGGEIKLTVSVKGNLGNIRNFLFELENMKKEIEINSLKFSRNEEEGKIFWRMSFIISAKTK